MGRMTGLSDCGLFVGRTGNTKMFNRTVTRPVVTVPKRTRARAFLDVNGFRARTRTYTTGGCLCAGFLETLLKMLGIARGNGGPI